MSSTTVLLKDIATREVTCLSVGKTLGEAANLMAQRRFSSIVVVDDGRHPVGIITERNILKAMHDGLPLQSSLSEAMSAPVITMHGDVDSLEAYETCTRAGIRHLVLVDDNGVVDGVVSETDFRLHLSLTALAGRRKISSIAKQSAIALPPDCALTQAVDLMHAQRKSCVIVIEQERPIGIVTERDMVRLYSSDESHLGLTLGKVMKSPVLTIPRDATTNHAAEVMLAHKVRHLVAVDGDGRMTGLVSEHDMTQAMIGGLAEERAGIEENILRALLDTLPDLVWLKDEQGVYLACNRRFEMFFGAREADIVGKTDYDFVTREQADFFRENDRRAIAIGKSSVNEEWLTFSEDGYRGLFEAVKTPMYNKRGKLIGVLGVARDITERKRTEEALHFLAQRGGADNAESILSEIAQYLGKALDVDYVVIDRLAEEDGVAETAALYTKGKIAPNFRYALKGTPCDNVVGKGMCCYSQAVQTKFPDDKLLVDLQVESYAGIPLWDSKGQPIGLIAVMHGKSFVDEVGIIRLLQMMSVRAATELERSRSDQLLRIREQEFRTLAENAPENIVRYDRDCRAVYVNPRMLQTLRISAAEMLYKRPTEVITGELSEAYEATIRRVIEQRVEQHMELMLPDVDGEVSYQSIRFVPEIDQAGKVTGALAMGSDITELKQAEQALRQSLELSEGVINAVPDLLFELDRDGRYINIWAHEATLLAKQKELLLGRTVREMLPSAAADAVMSAIVEADANGASGGQVISLDLAEGTRWFELSTAAKAASKGEQIRHFIMLSRDVTQRKQAELKLFASEERLKQNEELLRTLIEAIPDAIQFKDGEGRWLESNSAARAAFGLDVETSQGRSDAELSELVDPRFKSAILQCAQTDLQAWQAGHTSRVEETMQTPDGNRMVFDVIKVPLFSDDHERKGLVIVGRDVSELKRVEGALRYSVEEYSGLVQRIPVGVYKYRMCADGGAAFDYVSPRWCELLGVTEEEVMRDTSAAYRHILPEEMARFEHLNNEARRNLDRFEWEGRIVGKSGEVRWLHIESQPTKLENGDILWDGIQYDVTDRRRAEETLRINASVFDTSQEAIVITDADNCIIDVNHAFTIITGYARDEVLGRDPRLLSSGRQDKAFYESMWKSLEEKRAWRGEIWNRRKEGELFAELLSISVICDAAGQVQRYVGVFSDITYFKEHEEELSQVANYDALTGIPNRRLLADRLGQAIAHAQRVGKLLAVCYLDLDGFKEVNDRYGHKTGDELLVDITRRLQDELRAGDTLARLGGDEFIMLFNDLTQVSECTQVLERLMQTVSAPVLLGEHSVGVSASIGVAFYPEHGEDGDSLLRCADRAMYIAKQNGKNRFHCYTQD